MAREYDLKPAPSSGDSSGESATSSVNRRQFLRYGFNTATGVLAASLGVLGFASILLPPGGTNEGELGVKFWAKGREDSAWYGAKHEQMMSRQDFVDEAAKSNTETSGAAGIWNGDRDMRLDKEVKIKIQSIQNNSLSKSLRFGL
jgi:hypothetical protein